MEKNKSIDGLKPRRSKKTVSSTSRAIKSSKSAKSPKSAKVAKSTKPTVSAKSTKTTKSTKKTIPKTTQKKVAQISKKTIKTPTVTAEDFLKPVQAFNFDSESGELTATDNIPSTSKKLKKEKKPMSKKRKITISIITTIIILLIAAAICFILWGNDIIAKITGGQGNVFDLLFVDNYVDLKTDENGRTNILAFGTSGYDMSGDEGNGVHDGAQLTDSIMVISLNQETGDVAMLSLPRDLKASPTCTATGKINEVYWCNNMEGNNEQAGAEALMTEVGSILGLDFQYYAHINWGSLISIVDALGGIQVTLDEDINDYNYTGAVYQAGVEYTLDGAQAMGLSRARHGTAEGDFSRGASQQKILIGIKNKVQSSNLSITDLMNLAGTLGDNLRTNFSIDEMKSFAHLSYEFDFDNIRQISLLEPVRLMTNGTINGISYVLPSAGQGNYGRIQDFIAKMFSNDPRTYEDYNILVLNGTEEVGIASTEKIALEDDGYTNIDTGDAPTTFTDKYTLYAITNTAPGTKKLLEKKYSTTAKTSEELPEGISRDYDFVLVIGSE